MKCFAFRLICVLAVFQLTGCAEALWDTVPPTAETSAKALVVTQPVDIQTAHPYQNYTSQSWEVRAPEGAESLTLHFDRIEIEDYYDYLDVFDAAGTLVARLTGMPDTRSVRIDGDYALLRFYSDYSVTMWGFSLSQFSYEADEPDHPTDHRPYCGAIGTRSEGWYWGDTGELIRFERCADLAEPECGAIGTRSEGWYSSGDPGLIAWDNCHRTVRLALIGEPCGGSIGFTCYGSSYCQGMPTAAGIIGGTGTCQPFGYCETVEDCSEEGNMWIHPMCMGWATCNAETSQCGWHCGSQPAPGPWSWTTVLLNNTESPHPYPNDYNETWDVVRPGAEQIRVHFPQIEVEEGYDQLIFTGDREEVAVMVDGVHSDYWTPAFGGDTLHITLETDYSVTGYGFRADMVSYYEQLRPGTCNRAEDCQAGYECAPRYCFNPYAPCYGDCHHDDRCDDGEPITCRAIPPTCAEGTILAFQHGCYSCVDPDTCESPVPGGNEGDVCDADHPCNERLHCKAVVDGVGQCRDERWCDPATVEADCSTAIHPAIPGAWTCVEHGCRWQAGGLGVSYTSDQKFDIPDDDPTGIQSGIDVSSLLESCDYRVNVDVRIRHTYRGDLVVGLTAPSGRRSLLHVREGSSADDLVLDRFPVTELGVGDLAGEWILDVSDHAFWDVGTLETWTLRLDCR